MGTDLWNYTSSCHLRWKQTGFQKVVVLEKVNKRAVLKILCCAFRMAYAITYVGNESNCPYHHSLWIMRNAFRSLFLRYRQCVLQFVFVTDSLKWYIWSIAFCGAATWSFRKVDQKCLENFRNMLLAKDGKDKLDR